MAVRKKTRIRNINRHLVQLQWHITNTNIEASKRPPTLRAPNDSLSDDVAWWRRCGRRGRSGVLLRLMSLASRPGRWRRKRQRRKVMTAALHHRPDIFAFTSLTVLLCGAATFTFKTRPTFLWSRHQSVQPADADEHFLRHPSRLSVNASSLLIDQLTSSVILFVCFLYRDSGNK